MHESEKTRTTYESAHVYFLFSLFALAFPLIAAAGSIELMASKDKMYCEQVLKLFQGNMGGGSRFSFNTEPFSAITWEQVSVAGVGPKARHCASLDKALIDLDNDGTKDLVVKTTFCMKGSPSDSFYVFPADSRVLEQASWQDMSPLLATSDKFERTGGTYPLTALPIAGSEKPVPVLRTVFTLQPFAIEGKISVALWDTHGAWIVVANYLRGERFEDQCYFRSSPE
jgi:hypothetical protein